MTSDEEFILHGFKIEELQDGEMSELAEYFSSSYYEGPNGLTEEELHFDTIQAYLRRELN